MRAQAATAELLGRHVRASATVTCCRGLKGEQRCPAPALPQPCTILGRRARDTSANCALLTANDPVSGRRNPSQGRLRPSSHIRPLQPASNESASEVYHLARLELDRDSVAFGLVEQLDGDADTHSFRFCSPCSNTPHVHFRGPSPVLPAPRAFFWPNHVRLQDTKTLLRAARNFPPRTPREDAGPTRPHGSRQHPRSGHRAKEAPRCQTQLRALPGPDPSVYLHFAAGRRRRRRPPPEQARGEDGD